MLSYFNDADFGEYEDEEDVQEIDWWGKSIVCSRGSSKSSNSSLKRMEKANKQQ